MTEPPGESVRREELLALLRKELPVLLRGDDAFRHELVGLLSESLTTRAETQEILVELRSLREAMDRRFEAMDRRFEAVLAEMRDQRDWVGVTVGGFQRRSGRGLEDAIAGTLHIALGV